MPTNNFAELTGQPAQLTEHDQDAIFMFRVDDGKQEYRGSCHRYFAIPTLDDIEHSPESKTLTREEVALLIASADESESLYFGNSFTGFYLRHGDRFTTIAKLFYLPTLAGVTTQAKFSITGQLYSEKK